MIPDAPTLVLGGARSGKSRYACALAEASGLARIFIATAQGLDDEMQDRIARHKAERGIGWRTMEAPLDLVDALNQGASPKHIVVIDCLTLWLSNQLFAEQDLESATASLIAAVAALKGPAIFVSNEVGHGLVPESPLGRQFRDAQGRLNQSIAQVCKKVVLVVAGCPLIVKGR